MAQPFFRYKAAAQKAAKPGQKLTFSGGVYRLAGGTPAPVQKPQAQGNGLPVYTPPDRTAVMGEANTQAQGIYEPLLAEITRRYEQQRQEAAARTAATQAATQKAYADARDPMANLWNSAIQQGTTLENAVSNRLKGVGDTRGADFAAKLAAMGAPQTGAAQELATTYQGADAAKFASGMNDVGRLVSRGAESRSWLEKQPGLAAQQSQAELAEALNELAKGQMDESGELTANIPAQVQELFDKIYGQKEQAGKDVYEDKWTRIKHLEQQKKDAQEAQLVAREMGDKAAEARAKAEAKRIDQEIKMRGQDITVRGQDITEANNVRSTSVTEANNIRSNTKKNTTPKGRTDEQQRLREAAANKGIKELLFRRDKGGRVTNQQADWVTQSKNWNQVAQKINAVLRENGISINSPNGIRLRKAAFSRLGIKTGAGGNPIQ